MVTMPLSIVTPYPPLNVHDNLMLPSLLDPENDQDFVWSDSAYSGESFAQLLNLGGFESLSHEKGVQSQSLSTAAKDLIHIK